MMPIHQYDFDVVTCLNFLREYGLLKHFKLNLETNHATLARHTMHHECEVAAAAGALGKEDFISLEKYAMSQPDPVQYTSGRQEFCENIINAFI